PRHRWRLPVGIQGSARGTARLPGRQPRPVLDHHLPRADAVGAPAAGGAGKEAALIPAPPPAGGEGFGETVGVPATCEVTAHPGSASRPRPRIPPWEGRAELRPATCPGARTWPSLPAPCVHAARSWPDGRGARPGCPPAAKHRKGVGEG